MPYEKILTPEALQFVNELVAHFRPRLLELLLERKQRQLDIDAGKLPTFLPHTQHIRQAAWSIGAIPKALHNRKIEITGPVEAKMIINALNAPVNVFMADFEDSLSPTWDALMQGQLNLQDAVRGTLQYTDEKTGKHYQLNKQTATLMVRPRGLHLFDKHMSWDDSPIPGCLLDFGLYFFHNARYLAEKSRGPYFYIPKLQSHLEARWWNEVFNFAEDKLAIPRGTLKVTVLIETLPAAFEMDEILYELKDHIVGLNCGRWDYIFSFIKTLRNHADKVLPDRQGLTMDKPFLAAYSKLLIKTAHRRGAFAMGGMSAFIPIKDNEEANSQALAKVKVDKEREVKNGHDGTWIAHPGLIPVVKEVFDRLLPEDNQLQVLLEDLEVTQQQLLAVPEGQITEEGIRHNIRVALQYMAAWLSGNGCVPLYNLMEDAATAEICRTQLWQWLYHEKMTLQLFQQIMNEEMALLPASNHLDKAAVLLGKLTAASECPEFLTTMAYEYL